MIRRLVIFGATGDLTSRYLLPAVARLHEAAKLPDGLFLDVLEGDPTLSIRADEAEESWRMVEPIREAWAEGRPPLSEYEAGSAGPVER